MIFLGEVSLVDSRASFDEGLSFLVNPYFIDPNCLVVTNLLSLYVGETSLSYLFVNPAPVPIP